MSDLKNAREREQRSLTELREQLTWLRARHDDGAVSPAVFAVIRDIEVSIARVEHAR
jgi:hypothetical protein